MSTQLDQPVRGSDHFALYKKMLQIRRVEEAILRLRRADEISGSVHLCVGQESAPVGVAAALDHRDRVIATYRGHGWALACGVPAEELLGEVLGRATGTNFGRAGSAYLTAPAYGFVGENSIVGAGLPIANGVAMAMAQRAEGGVVAVSFGDGATNQGGAHEALVFAIARSLPVVFVCENNLWSEMTPITATVPRSELWQRAQGYGMPAELVDGSDVRTVLAAARRAIARARAGDGPTFLEIQVPRILGHYNADIEHYRSDADKAAHAERDPIAWTRQILARESAPASEALARVDQEVEELVEAAVEGAIAAPLPDRSTAAGEVTAEARPSALAPLPAEGNVALGLAINRALDDELACRPELVVFGEDVAIPGGTFGVTRNLLKKYGDRVFDTPISEAAILGAALGASLEGLRPVVEIMWMDFLLVALDQLVNQAANVRYLSSGRLSAPMVVRLQQGANPGSCAQHSQSLEALLAHIPGIRVGLPSTAQDAYQMLRAAVADPDPVVLVEARRLYVAASPLDTTVPPESVGGARLRREGSDLAMVTWGTMVDQCLMAADRLQAEHGISAAVLDLRWLNPLDEAAIAGILRDAGGKLLIVHEANLTGGFGAEVAARVAERHLDLLDAPIRRIGTPDSRIPASPVLQAALIPDAEVIEATALELHRF
ncbi:MAG TPA: thiamine pyrophosphate-dependent enzyme [Streptosporangiaceae bacterium]|nr:thiamine pyrophosphate-dependent enzyme [Streptosporangiaceae bacterium]